MIKHLLVALSLVAGCGGKKDEAGGGGAAEAAQPSVLARLEKFPRPGTEPDTYDHIKAALALKAEAARLNQPPPVGTVGAFPLPPTPADTLAYDVHVISLFDMGFGHVDAKAITLGQVTQVIELYTKGDARRMHGLRPEMFKAFIMTLTPEERTRLAQELVDHIHQVGWTGTDTAADRPPMPRSELANEVFGGGGGAQTAAKPTEPVEPVEPVDTGPVPTYAGTYRSTWGTTVFTQTAADPHSVVGTYPKGTLTCQATSAALKCRYKEGSIVGGAVMKRQANGNLAGTFGVGKSATSEGAWNFTLTKPGALQ